MNEPHGIGIRDMLIIKLKTSISKTKCLERFAWIKTNAIVKEAFKNWKALLASTPQKNGWSFVVN